MRLSVLDYISPTFFVPAVLVYEEPECEGEGSHHHHQHRDFPAAVRILEESLAKVLVEFYPLAGRLVKGPQGYPEVRCDDAGAIFTQAVVEETLEEAGGMEALLRVTGMDAAGLGDKTCFPCDNHDELPLLVIQVNKYSSSSMLKFSMCAHAERQRERLREGESAPWVGVNEGCFIKLIIDASLYVNLKRAH